MKIILFGATGMVGQGVLRECLRDPDVDSVLSVSRNSAHQQHPKFHETLHTNLLDLSAIEKELSGFDACFFCLGISSAGMSEKDYHRITYDITMSVASTLIRLNPGIVFIFVSGAGTDSTEQSRTMWARVKGKTENALLRMPFKVAYMFRPAFIQPLHGIVSKTKAYRIFYGLMSPLYPLVRKIFPKYVSTTEQIGRAMLYVAKHGSPKSILETEDINRNADLAMQNAE